MTGKRPWHVLEYCADFRMDRLTAKKERPSQGTLALCTGTELHLSFQHRYVRVSSVHIATGYGLQGTGI